MKPMKLKAAAAASLLALGLVAAATAQEGRRQAKDVVLAPLMPAAAAQPMGAPRPAANYDGMAVSVLLETPEGVLVPRSTETVFSTGQHFRLKVMAPRDGEILVYNTNPLGQTSPAPVWKTPVRAGLEAVSPPLMLTGNRGEDQLHVVLQPVAAPPQGAFAWFQDLFAGKNLPTKASKDVQLVTESTPQATYFYNTGGQGGYVTIRVRHQ